jgi:hypothetical protein
MLAACESPFVAGLWLSVTTGTMGHVESVETQTQGEDIRKNHMVAGETERQNTPMKLLFGNLGYHCYSFKKMFSTQSKHHPYASFHLSVPCATAQHQPGV